MTARLISFYRLCRLANLSPSLQILPEMPASAHVLTSRFRLSAE
jgi:hypothetical protein